MLTILVEEMYSWVLLALASIFEVGWPLGFRLASLHEESRALFLLMSVFSMALSGYFLYLAQKSIPVSTAYVIWTGAGALGTFLIGFIWFEDTVSALKALSALLVIAGIVGLELL